MFSNLSPQDKQGFFSLLDEYFMTRPHLLGGGGGGNNANRDPSPLQSLQSLNRFLSPSQAAQGSPTSPNSPKTPEDLAREAKQKEDEAKRMDMVTKLTAKGVKHGTAGARSSISMISRNSTAMKALDKNGLGNLVRSADSLVGKKTAQEGQGQNGAASPPPNSSGHAGLVSTKSFGHVDTGSKMSAFTSMWKDPQKAQAPTANVYQPPAFQNSRSTLPPPQRNGSATVTPVQQVQAVSAEVQAQALYDYEGSDTGDLGIQTGQILIVLEKTSDDWWMCEDGNGTRGLVPANYLKEI